MSNENNLKWKPIPSLKSEQVEELFKSFYGVDRKSSIENCTCVSCNSQVSEDGFREELSLREYHISGLCQVCQDKVFGFDETLEK